MHLIMYFSGYIYRNKPVNHPKLGFAGVFLGFFISLFFIWLVGLGYFAGWGSFVVSLGFFCIKKKKKGIKNKKGSKEDEGG